MEPENLDPMPRNRFLLGPRIRSRMSLGFSVCLFCALTARIGRGQKEVTCIKSKKRALVQPVDITVLTKTQQKGAGPLWLSFKQKPGECTHKKEGHFFRNGCKATWLLSQPELYISKKELASSQSQLWLIYLYKGVMNFCFINKATAEKHNSERKYITPFLQWALKSVLLWHKLD